MLALALLASLVGAPDTLLHTWHPRTWYADLLAGPAQASPDGRFLLYTCEGRQMLVTLADGALQPLAERLGWEDVSWARWAGTGARLLVIGRDAGAGRDAEVDLDGGEFGASGLWREVHDVLVTARPGRRVVAARRAGEPALWLEDPAPAEPRALVAGFGFLAWAAAPDGSALAFLRTNEAGWADLWHVELDTGATRLVAGDLDTSYQPTAMAWWRDEVLLSLVGAQHGTPEEKQDPRAERDLDIFAVALADGTRRPVVEGPGDDLVSGVAGEQLFWTHVETDMRVALVPLPDENESAGETREAGASVLRELVGATASYPSWHPDGLRVAAMFGPMTLADWALNWDLGAVTLDAELRPTGPLQALVRGPHEDFGLSWSPDGRWMAYHSHRSPGPAMAYAGHGATDDIWLRPAQGGAEVRLSRDAGFEVCQPTWSPDGYELVFVAVDPRARRYRPVRIEIDPRTGAATAQHDFLVPGIDGDVIAAAYSPVAPELALEERTAGGEHRLWMAALEGGAMRLLATFRALPEVSGIDVTPDGAYVLYTALNGAHHQLFRVATDGASQPRRLTDAAEELFTPRVAPDGRHAALTVYTHTKTVHSRVLESAGR